MSETRTGFLVPNDKRTKIYNPARDVTHALSAIAMEAARRLDDMPKLSPELDAWRKAAQVTNEELEKTVLAYLNAINAAATFDELSGDPTAFERAMEQAGIKSLRPEAIVLYMAALGLAFFGFAYAGIQDATVFESDPVADLRALIAKGREAVLAHCRG